VTWASPGETPPTPTLSAIFEKFREHQIRIPFPQRDVHLKTVPQGWESSPGG
jgi:small-conductance mechanosensitive channel